MFNARIKSETVSVPASSCEKHAGLIPAMIQLEEGFELNIQCRNRKRSSFTAGK